MKETIRNKKVELVELQSRYDRLVDRVKKDDLISKQTTATTEEMKTFYETQTHEYSKERNRMHRQHTELMQVHVELEKQHSTLTHTVTMLEAQLHTATDTCGASLKRLRTSNRELDAVRIFSIKIFQFCC